MRSKCQLDAVIAHIEREIARLSLQLMGSLPTVPGVVDLNAQFLKSLLNAASSRSDDTTKSSAAEDAVKLLLPKAA